MGVIHVLEIRYAPTKDGPWSREEPLDLVRYASHDHDWGAPEEFRDGLKRFRQLRHRAYIRLDKTPGTEPPPNADVKFTRDEHGRPRLVYYVHVTRSWHYAEPGASGEAIAPPAWYTALPPAEEQSR